ncbi:MAG TPA: helix-turn-helix domain-containing protein [Vicinamibacterales bacterium]|nr:helix-turn-helix domain-containing protein [Vicinamibacterales bacterium]
MATDAPANPAAERDPDRAAQAALRPALRPEAGPDQGDHLWAIAEVSDYLQISVSSLYKMTARKAAVRIPHIRIGGKLRFRRSDIDQWLTLLTVSNLDTLTKMRTALAKRTHGHDSQTQAP